MFEIKWLILGKTFNQPFVCFSLPILRDLLKSFREVKSIYVFAVHDTADDSLSKWLILPEVLQVAYLLTPVTRVQLVNELKSEFSFRRNKNQSTSGRQRINLFLAAPKVSCFSTARTANKSCSRALAGTFRAWIVWLFVNTHAQWRI